MNNRLLLAAAILILNMHQTSAFADSEDFKIGGIYFYGCDGYNIDDIKKSIPVHAGDTRNSAEVLKFKEEIDNSVHAATTELPTQTAIVDCGDGIRNIYIGLHGKSVVTSNYNPPPTGDARLPNEILKLNDESMEYLQKLLREKGGVTQDMSKGYALNNEDFSRSQQLAMRAWVLQNVDLAKKVLATSADAYHRAVAAEAIGYLDPSSDQIDALTAATRDENLSVRNNATRALGCIAASKTEFASKIAPDRFIEMMNSGIWTDRNKGQFVFASLCRRDENLIYKVQNQVFECLAEMAVWDDSHALSARSLVAKIGKIPANEVDKLLREYGPSGLVETVRKKMKR